MKSVSFFALFVCVASALFFSSVSRALAHSPAFSSDTDEENYFTISSVVVRELDAVNDPVAQALNLRAQDLLRELVGLDATTKRSGKRIFDLPGAGEITDWITIGEKIWSIVVANKPVVEVGTHRVSVLPKAQPNWLEIERWQGPMSKSYVVEAKNLAGMTTVRNAYTVAFYHSGQYEGKGRYLANATIIPSDVQVSWGYTLNSKVEVADTINVNTKQNPTPAVDLQLQWQIKTVLKHAEARTSYFVRGDGKVVLVNPRPL